MFFLLLSIQLGCIRASNHIQCSQTCEKLYGSDGDCQFISPGDPDGEKSAELCMDECKDAMSTYFGEVGEYDPNEKTSSSQSVPFRALP